jgi:hypothetical protein
MVFNASFNNISITTWRSVLFVEETGVTGENHQADARPNLYHIMLCRVHLTWAGFELTALVAMGIKYIGSCKSNYHTLTTTTAPT